MENSTVGMIVTTLVVLLSGLSGLSGLSVFFVPFIGGVSALMHSMPGGALTAASIISAATFAWTNGCCICIPIPLAFGALTLFRRRNASALEGTLSQPGADR